MKHFSFFKYLFSVACFTLITLNTALANNINPAHVYLYHGKPVAPWSITLGDPSNWFQPVQAETAQHSAGQKVSIKPTTFDSERSAIQVEWDGRKKLQGNFSLSGEAIDLSALKDVVALVLDIRVDRKPDKAVSLSLDCGYPCQGKVSMQKMLQKSPQKQWISLPIPLNCFKGDTFDLSKINGVAGISTDGRLSLSLLNIRLEKLPDGDNGCLQDE